MRVRRSVERRCTLTSDSDSEKIKLNFDIYFDRSTFLFISAKGGHKGGMERKKTVIANMKNIHEYEK